MTLCVLLAFAAWAQPGGHWKERPPLQLPSPALGTAWVSPNQFEVHEKTTVDYVYRVGAGGMDEGDSLRIEDPVFHGIRFSKWSIMDTDPDLCEPLNPEGSSYSLVTASTTGAAELDLERSTDSPDIHEYAWTEVWVASGSLAEGDEIVVRFGDDADNPDCAMQTPDRTFHQVPWRVYEWVADQADYTLVAPVPYYDVLPREEPSGLLVSVPSYAVSSEPFRVKVAVLDDFGNPLLGWAGDLQVSDDYGGQLGALDGSRPAWLDLEAVAQPGVHRVTVYGEGGLVGVSNPVVISEQAPDRYLYWGDIHSHHGHSYEAEDGSWVDENVIYARDIVGLDVASESMKGQPIEIDGEQLWFDLVDNCLVYTDPGAFVSLLGWEWMGGIHGHHNIYYDACDGELGNLGVTNLAETDGLWAWMRDHQERTGVRGISVPHASMYTGFDWFRANAIDPEGDAEFRTAAEVYSAWGSSMAPDDTPGSVPSALAEGLKLGFIASSDNHVGWMGNGWWSEKNTLPGLAAFWAEELTAEAIFGALQGRATYGTNGPRIIADYWLEDGGTVVVAGGEHDDLGTVRWDAHGTDLIDEVRVMGVSVADGARSRELHVMPSLSMSIAGSYDLRSKDLDGSDEMAVWVEVEQVDGGLAWTSPIWVQRKGCGCSSVGSGGAVAWLALLVALGRRRCS